MCGLCGPCVIGIEIRKVKVVILIRKRPLERPQQTFFDTMKRDLSKINNKLFGFDMATNEDNRRRIVEAGKDLNGPY